MTSRLASEHNSVNVQSTVHVADRDLMVRSMSDRSLVPSGIFRETNSRRTSTDGTDNKTQFEGVIDEGGSLDDESMRYLYINYSYDEFDDETNEIIALAFVCMILISLFFLI